MSWAAATSHSKIRLSISAQKHFRLEVAASRSYIATDTPCAFERRARGLFGGPCFLGKMLNDGWLDAYDCAVVVSNDSDIAESMRLVKDQHGKRIGLITPGTRSPSRQLLAHADFARRIRSNALRRSQLPDPIPGTTIRKPPRW